LDSADPLGVSKPRIKAPAGGIAPTPQAGSAPAAPAYRPPSKPGTSALEAFSDILDVPLNLGSAFFESPGAPWDPAAWKKTGADVGRAWGILRKKGPKALGEEYFPTSQAALERKAPNDPFSGAALKYPAVRALGAVASEAFNPSNVLLPAAAGVAGKAVGAGANIAAKVPGVARASEATGKFFAEPFDRYYGVRKAGGAQGEAAMRNLESSSKRASSAGEQQAIDLFKPEGGQALTIPEKTEIVRRSQGLKPADVHIPTGKTSARLSPDAMLTARGKAVRQAIKSMDAAQIAAHPELLPPGSTFNPETYFPMSGQYRNPEVTDEVAQFLDQMRPSGGGGGLRTVKGTASPSAPSKAYADFDKMQLAEKQRVARGEDPLLKPDFDPAQALGRHLARRGRNVAIEQGIQKLPPSLAPRLQYEWPAGSGQALVPKHLKIEDFAHWGNQAEEQFAKATKGMHAITPAGLASGKAVEKLLGTSPSAAQRAFHPEAIRLMTEAGAPAQQATGFAAFGGLLNKLMRIGIITNPVVHVGWNLFGNYLGAKGDPAKLGYIASGQGWKDAATWDKLAEENGAHAHIGTHSMLGGDTARLLTSSGGSPLERMDRALTKGWNANQRLVFDTMEKRFSTALFSQKVHELQAAGVSTQEALARAGIAVRKTFGDYANVHPGGFEGAISKGFFFYPWLKTIMPFVAKTAVQNPSWITKPVRGIQAWNQGMGDPNAQAKSNALYLGRHGGQERYLSAPFPQRNLEDLLQMVPTPQKGLTGSLKAATDLAANHAGLPAGLAIDAFMTAAGQAKPPGGINRHTLFDKAAPFFPEQVGQAARNVGGRVVPPMLQNLPALAKGDMSPLLGALGGTTYTRPSVVQSKQTNVLRAGMLRAIHQANAIGDKKLADDLYRLYTRIGQGMGLP
jgi:hypothetical protein